jgi:hypothetical protein
MDTGDTAISILYKKYCYKDFQLATFLNSLQRKP